MQNPKVPGAQHNVNPARAITWFVGVIYCIFFYCIYIYCIFFTDNPPPPGQFLCNKILLKKLATVRGMLIEQRFKLKGPGHIYTPISGCFHDKAIIFKENIRLDCYLLLKYCRRQCFSLTSTWAKPLTKFNPKMQDFKRVLDLNCKQKEN